MNQKIRPNISELKRLVTDRFDGNKAAFAKALGVDRGQISKILNDDGGSGALFFGGLLAFCERERLYFKDFIIMPKNVNLINTSKSRGTSDGPIQADLAPLKEERAGKTGWRQAETPTPGVAKS